MGRCSTVGARALAADSEPYAYTLYRRLALPCVAPSPHRIPRIQALLLPVVSRSAPMRLLSLSLRSSRAAGIGSYLCAHTYTYTRGSRQHALPRLRSGGRMFTFRRAPTFSTLLSSRVIVLYTEYNLFSKLLVYALWKFLYRILFRDALLFLFEIFVSRKFKLFAFVKTVANFNTPFLRFGTFHSRPRITTWF